LFVFKYLDPQMRRILINTAKEAKSSDAVIEELHKCDTIVLAEVPYSKFWGEQLEIRALYRVVADEILCRFTDCLRLFGDAPASYIRSCWFVVSGEPGSLDLDSPILLEPCWEVPASYCVEYEHVAKDEIAKGLPTQATPQAVRGVAGLWDKLSSLCQVEELVATFADRIKNKECLAAGLKRVEAERFRFSLNRLKDLHGFDVEELLESVSSAEELRSRVRQLGDEKGVRIPRDLVTEWLVEGMALADWQERDKLRKQQYEQPGENRLLRAFQFFSNSFRMKNPFKFLTLVTSLEALFGTDESELTFQLAARVAWFLHPGEPKDRRDVFNAVKEFYKLRSQIVHGSSYKAIKLGESEGRLLEMVQGVLLAILRDAACLARFTVKCDTYLKALPLGDAALYEGHQ